MFSTYSRAKSGAKALHRKLRSLSIGFQLHECQQAVARGAGFRDWHHLHCYFKDHKKFEAQSGFVQKLLSNLPPIAREPAHYIFERESFQFIEPRGPWNSALSDSEFEFASFTLHYRFAVRASFSRNCAIIMPGSGPGSRNRANIVHDILSLFDMMTFDEDPPIIDPTTYALRHSGDFDLYFPTDRRRIDFDQQFQKLSEAGVLKWSPHAAPRGTIELIPDPSFDVAAHVRLLRQNTWRPNLEGG